MSTILDAQHEREHTLIPILLEQEVAKAERTGAESDVMSATGLIEGAQIRGMKPEILAPFRDRLEPLFLAVCERARLNLIRRIKDRVRESGGPPPAILGRLEARCYASKRGTTEDY